MTFFSENRTLHTFQQSKAENPLGLKALASAADNDHYEMKIKWWLFKFFYHV